MTPENAIACLTRCNVSTSSTARERKTRELSFEPPGNAHARVNLQVSHRKRILMLESDWTR